MQFTPLATGRSSSSRTGSTVVNDKRSTSQTESIVAERHSVSTVSDTQPCCQGSISVDQPAHLPTSSMVIDDLTPNLDIGDSTDSLTSRTESGYIEFSNLSTSVQYEEQKYEEKQPSYVNSKESRDSSKLLIVQTHAVENTSSNGLSNEKVAPSSSCVTWDEKAEIVEFREESCDIEEVPEMQIGSSDNQVHQAIDQAKSDCVAMPSNSEAIQVIFCSNDVDEIDSETDSFEDALNTIESESEGNIACQTKREVDQYSCDVNANEDNEMHLSSDSRVDIQAIEREHLSPEVKDESQVVKIPEQIENYGNHDQVFAKCHVTSNISTGVLEQEGLHDASTSVDGTDKQMAETFNFITPSGSDCALVLERPNLESVNSVPPSSSPGAFLSPDPLSAPAKVLKRPNIDSVATVPSSLGINVVNLPDPTTDRIIDSVSESKTSHSESSSTHSIGLWTNGGLLGLEPSKPPVFAATNLRDHNDEANNIEVNGSSNCTNVTKFSDSKGKPVSLTGNPNGMENGHSSSHVKASTLIDDLDGKSVRTGGSFPINSINQNVADYLSSQTMIPGGKVVSPATKPTSTESGQVNGGGLVRIIGLGNRLLASGISNSEDVSLMKTGTDAEQELRNPSARFNRNAEKAFGNQLESGSPVSSRISSPPLQHMKISFNPVNGFETSKLKLKFPDQSHRHESITDLFASFQLVPSPGFRLQDDDSDSDDDTFCRSSPYMSDDCDSHYSESNSEQWESDESPESKDPELYEAFRRMPYLDSVSCLVQDEEETIESICTGQKYKDGDNNGAETNVSDSLVDFPSSGLHDPSMQENIKHTTQNNLLQLQNAQEPTPLAPPLPPEEWLISKSFTSLDEEKLSKSSNVKFDTEVLSSTMSQKHKIEAAANQPQITDEGILFRPERKVHFESVAHSKEQSGRCNVHFGALYNSPYLCMQIIEKPNLHKGKEGSQSMRVDTKEDFLQQIRSKVSNFTLVSECFLYKYHDQLMNSLLSLCCKLRPCSIQF